MDVQSKAEIEILQNLKAGRWGEVERTAFAVDSIAVDLRDDILKMTRFWQKRLPLFGYENDKSGIKLYSEWESFIDFCTENRIHTPQIFYAVKNFVLKRVTDFLGRASRECDNSSKEILILLAYAFDELELTGKAIETLNYVLAKFPDDEDFRVYTLLGDIYSLDKDYQRSDYAVLYFNELFLKCANKVTLDTIASPIINRIADAVRSDYFAKDKIPYWIPIYGYLFGGLTLRRRLEYDEYKKLQSKISYYEGEMRNVENAEIIIPSLLNIYFWVFDYYIYQMKTPSGAKQIYTRVLQLIASLCRTYSYEEAGKKLGLQAERVLDSYLREAGIY